MADNMFKQASDSYIQAINDQGKKTVTEVNSSVTSGTNSLEVYKGLKLKELQGVVTGYKATAKNEITIHATSEVARVTQEGEKQVAEVKKFGVDKVIAEGEKQIENIKVASNTEQGNIRNKGQEELDKIKATGMDTKLDKGNYTGNAEDLKNEIDEKASSSNAVIKLKGNQYSSLYGIDANNSTIIRLEALKFLSSNDVTEGIWFPNKVNADYSSPLDHHSLWCNIEGTVKLNDEIILKDTYWTPKVLWQGSIYPNGVANLNEDFTKYRFIAIEIGDAFASDTSIHLIPTYNFTVGGNTVINVMNGESGNTSESSFGYEMVYVQYASNTAIRMVGQKATAGGCSLLRITGIGRF